jgi:hypothetical protein
LTPALPVALADTGEGMNHRRTRGLATRAHRRALAARDGGRTFPEYTVAPNWCQIHHHDDWTTAGHTDIDQVTLAST